MSKRHEEYKTRLTNRDITMLMEMYQLQAIRARDLVDIHFDGKKHGFDRLQELCARKYTEREYTVKGTGQRDRSVYNIDEDGINVLFRLGKLGSITQPRRARDLKLPTLEMLLRIEVSKIALYLKKAGWGIVGNKDGKAQLGLPPNSLMQLAFTEPDGKVYQVYILNKNIQDQTLIKLVSELADNKHGSIVLYKTDNIPEKTPAYENIVKRITEQRATILELCLIPMVEWNDWVNGGRLRNFAVETLLNSTNSQVEQYIKKKYGHIKYGDNHYGFGNIVVEQDGREYMVCNYLRRNQTALRALARQLTLSEYQNIGKGAIVLTWNGFAKEVQEIINSYQIRDFILVEGITVQDIIDSQAAK